MSSIADYIAVIGSSFRLSGGTNTFDDLWRVLLEDDWSPRSTRSSLSRRVSSATPQYVTGLRGEGLHGTGIENFDPGFFGITLEEAESLHPDNRLALELSWEAMERAGIPPSSLRGKNVAVVIAAGDNDTCYVRRPEGDESQSVSGGSGRGSEPGAIAASISRFFGFQGANIAVSDTWINGARALDYAVHALSSQEVELALVGALPAYSPLDAESLSPATCLRTPGSTDECETFIDQAEDCVYSKEAVFFVLKKSSAATTEGDVIQGLLRAVSISNSHCPSHASTIEPLSLKSTQLKGLKCVGVEPDDVLYLEMQGVEKLSGDVTAYEAIESIYRSSSREQTLVVSTRETVFGHSNAASVFIAMLKSIAYFSHRCIPPHHVTSRVSGSIIVPSEAVQFVGSKPIVSAFNIFSGSAMASIIMEEPPPRSIELPQAQALYALPFSGKTVHALHQFMTEVRAWTRDTRCSLQNLAVLLSITRDHHPVRQVLVVGSLDDLEKAIDRALTQSSQECSVSLAGELHEINQAYTNGGERSYLQLYSRHSIKETLLPSFPTYPFERRASIRTSKPTLSRSHSRSEWSAMQAKMEQLLDEYNTPLSTPSQPKVFPKSGGPITILLTGATGFVGSNLLDQLLQVPDVRIICLVRGDPLARVRKTFAQYALDDTILDRKLHAGSLQLVQTTDLSHEALGCSAESYSGFLSSVDYVVHCAWWMNFNFPVDKFRNDLVAVRRLAQLCALCEKETTLFFATSFSTSMAYEGTVPEEPLPFDVKYSLDQGYAHSKLVAEHMLYRLQGTTPAAFKLRVLRIGQVCGHSKTGAWVKDEMVPMLIEMAQHFGKTLADMPQVSWIPSDVCAGAIRDLILHDVNVENAVSVHNLANPNIRQWEAVIANVCEISRCPLPELLALKDFVDFLQDVPGDPNTPGASCKRLLPYLHYSLENGGLPAQFACLDVSRTASLSRTLMACPAVDTPLISVLTNWLLSPHDLSNSASTGSAVQTILVFGPWSSARPDILEDRTITQLLTKLKGFASATLQQTIPHREHSMLLDQGSPLHTQLLTLALHTQAMRQVEKHHVTPVAVAGYCFGEFAAAVYSGYLTEREAVDIITLRAYVVDHMAMCHGHDDKECMGATCQAKADSSRQCKEPVMLNAFTSLDIVRKQLVRMSSPRPEVAIVAGPTHIVLSGAPATIKRAQDYFLQQGVKTKTVETFIPFHSVEIEPAVRLLAKLLPTALGSLAPKPAEDRQEPSCAYISGLTGVVLRVPIMKHTYWLRHMRQTFLFQNAVESIRKTFHSPDSPTIVVDLGPGETVRNIVKRIGCSDIQTVTLDQFLSTYRSNSVSQQPSSFAGRHGSFQRKTVIPPLNDTDKQPIAIRLPTGDLDMTVRESACLNALSSVRDHRDSRDVLYETISTLVDSIQFIQLSSMMKDELGMTFPPSTFASSVPVIELLRHLQ